ncbi:MAG: serine/threonine protein kinase [Myxococcales bacterium]|nr:serine/threonine protein kinase [Myxococcales bacterium]
MAESFDDPLQRYQVMDPLGRGGSGTTFRGVDRATGRQVAIKVLSLRAIEGDWKRFDLFEREVAVLATLSHPGIPRYIDSYASEATGDYFLVMELVEGTPLSRHIEQQRRHEPAALRDLLDQGLTILEYLHSLSPPVIHRDIKPANLLVDVEGRLHLVDFGGVRRAVSAKGGTTMVGTFGYMAPEQLHGASGPATDLYALGATIVALHAGAEADTLPHDGLHFDLDALELPPGLAPVLQRMLEPDPKQRLSSVAEVRRALRPAELPPSDRTKSRTSPGAASSPSPSVDPDTEIQALVPTEGIRELARVPAPLSVLVWILTALAAGSLTVFQVLLMPLVFRMVRHFSRNDPPPKRAELEANLSRFEQTVAQTRRSFAFVAGNTHPIRDGDDDGKGGRSKDERRRR